MADIAEPTDNIDAAEPEPTCDFGWHTRDLVEDGEFVGNGEEVPAQAWTGQGETHHSCQLSPGHDGLHRCVWCGMAHE